MRIYQANDVLQLIRLYADELREMSHVDYEALVERAVRRVDSPAVVSSVRAARLNPANRVKNVIRGDVLRELHRQRTGEVRELDQSGLDLT